MENGNWMGGCISVKEENVQNKMVGQKLRITMSDREREKNNLNESFTFDNQLNEQVCEPSE